MGLFNRNAGNYDSNRTWDDTAAATIAAHASHIVGGVANVAAAMATGNAVFIADAFAHGELAQHWSDWVDSYDDDEGTDADLLANLNNNWGK
jgi:hypothetical protein